MKRKENFILQFVCGFVFIIMATSAHAIPMGYLTLSTTDIVVGDTFDLNVFSREIPDNDPLLTFGFKLDYNEEAFINRGWAVHSAFTDMSNSLRSPHTDVAAMAFPAVSGEDILLASLEFTALQQGNFALGILCDLSSNNNGLRTMASRGDMTQALNVSVGPAPVPEPSTLLLMGVGGLVLVRTRKRLGIRLSI